MQEELYNIKKFFPIDDEEIDDYLSKLFTTINLNYDNNEFQFAYIALHLVFMTYIYNLVWQISKLDQTNYQLASLFTRPFNGVKLDFNNVKSVFDYKNIPEKEIINYLCLIGLEKSYIGILKSQIEKRNSMAHASGTYDIIDINSYNPEKDTIIAIMEKCTNSFNQRLLIKYYIESIINWQNKKGINNEDFALFIDDYLIIDISISPIELKFISELSKTQFYKNMKYLNIEKQEQLKIYHNHLNISKIAKKTYLINYYEN